MLAKNALKIGVEMQKYLLKNQADFAEIDLSRIA